MNRRAIFDRVRKMLGRGFRQSEVVALDAAIDEALRETGEQLAGEAGVKHDLTLAGCDRVVSQTGVDLIKQFEGCRLVAYPDPGTGGEPWTIGWGSTRMNGKPIPKGLRITQAQADAMLLEDIERHANDVRAFLGDAPTTQGQFDAMASFHYNTGKLPASTLGKLHKAGKYDAAANEFPKWKFAAGQVLKGLVRRREAERALYLK